MGWDCLRFNNNIFICSIRDAKVQIYILNMEPEII